MNYTTSFRDLNYDLIANTLVPLLEQDKGALLQLISYIEKLDKLEKEEQKNLNLVFGLGSIEVKITLLEKIFMKLSEIDNKFINLDSFFSKNFPNNETGSTYIINERLDSLYPGLGYLINIPEEDFLENPNEIKRLLSEITKVSNLVVRFSDNLLQENIYKNLNTYWSAARELIVNNEDQETFSTVLEFIHTYSEVKDFKGKLTKQQQSVLGGYKLGIANAKNKNSKNISPEHINKLEEVADEQIIFGKDKFPQSNYTEFKKYLLKHFTFLKENDEYDIIKMTRKFSEDEQKEIIKLLYMAFDSSAKKKFITNIIESGYQDILTNNEKIELIFSLDLTIREKVQYLINFSLSDNYIFEKVYEVVNHPEDGIDLLPTLFETKYVRYCIRRSSKVNNLLSICEYTVNNNRFEIWDELKQEFIKKAFSLDDTLDNKISFIEQTGVLRETNKVIRLSVYEELYKLGKNINESLKLVLNNMEYSEDCLIFLQKEYNNINDSMKKEFINYVIKYIKPEQEEEILKHRMLILRKEENFQFDYLKSSYKTLKTDYDAIKYSSIDEDVIRARTILDVSKSISNFINKFEQRINEYKYIGINYDELGEELIAYKHLLRDSLNQMGIEPIVPLDNDVVNFYYRYHEAFNSLQKPTEGERCRVITNGLKVSYHGADEIISLAKVEVFGVDGNE
jgi:hypothetical protein